MNSVLIVYLSCDCMNKRCCFCDGQTPRRQRTLRCRYSTGRGNPRLIYAPIKEEQEWDHPLIIRYHDLVSEREIETIKHLSRSKVLYVWNFLNVSNVRFFQVANYGIGGQYEPHFDNKMSDVEVGGSTVFPDIGAALRPYKGSAVLWYNLLQNGEEDARTLHAACPVFVGNKWVANKWVRAHGQEFRRRCSLSQMD
uniref:Fe2OG dioxygenase domain-containing protein n=1 Tax=Oncorhynchus kisutch TaxID=8019 RepID=A0A8C7L4H2_ONCKI